MAFSTPQLPKLSLSQAQDFLLEGKVIAAPTDTIWGLIAHPQVSGSIKRLEAIKQRPSNKGYILLAPEFSLFTSLGIFSQPQEAEQALDQAFTSCILPMDEIFFPKLSKDGKTLGLRTCTHEPIALLCKNLASPLIASSANLSGQAHHASIAEIASELKGISGYLPGEPLMKQASRIYDLASKTFLR